MNLLRTIVAGPRVRHAEANLDLCYVTDNIIVTSGPSSSYPSRAYRNPLDALVRFLDEKHGSNWAIWEFRAEGAGYPDGDVYGRIRHFPWPDHHPPPFAVLPQVVESMKEWLDGPATTANAEHRGAGDAGDVAGSGRVAVVHCKAGKGRSGTATVSYLMSQEGWSKADGLARFTARRMRNGFGAGVSIPSQLRWVDYVEQWVRLGKAYGEQQIEVVEVHVWGLREGVKLAVEGYVDAGRAIKTFHVFKKSERHDDDDENGVTGAGVVRGPANPMSRLRQSPSPSSVNSIPTSVPTADADAAVTDSKHPALAADSPDSRRNSQTPSKSSSVDSTSSDVSMQPTVTAVFRPATPLILPTNDVNIAVERRTSTSYGWAVVTSVAHAWFNTYFEARREDSATDGPSDTGSGVFAIDWDRMDGIKGSARKGTRAFDRVHVVWRVAGSAADAAVAATMAAASGPPLSEQLGAAVAAKRSPGDVTPARSDGSGAALAVEAKSEGQSVEDDSEDGAEGLQRGVTHEPRPASSSA